MAGEGWPRVEMASPIEIRFAGVCDRPYGSVCDVLAVNLTRTKPEAAMRRTRTNRSARAVLRSAIDSIARARAPPVYIYLRARPNSRARVHAIHSRGN